MTLTRVPQCLHRVAAMRWEQPPGITPEAVDRAWLTTEAIGGWPWLDRIRERRGARKADREARRVEPSAVAVAPAYIATYT